ncbi:MAG: ChaN family lipoprotein [Pasteurellaceae bacterium]|nr:ChaN family lipoprotein [Pasteurellaceae bacterium]
MRWLKKFNSAFLCLMVALLSACQSLDLSQKNIYHTQTGQYFTLSQLVQKIQSEPMILVGEKHDNALHHQAEVALFQALNQTGNLQAVALEMLPSSQQSQIDHALQHIRQHKRIDNATVKQHLPWTEGWQWSQYGDLMVALSQSQVRILGGNLDRSEIATLFNGAYPLNGNRSTAQAVKQRIAQTIAQHHQLSAKEDHIQTMVSIQQFKDRRMAEALINGGKSTLLIAGNFHVNKAVGVPLHLADLGHKKGVVISLAKSIHDIAPEETDYIWVLP